LSRRTATVLQRPPLARVSSSVFFFKCRGPPRVLHSFPTRRSSDLRRFADRLEGRQLSKRNEGRFVAPRRQSLGIHGKRAALDRRSEEHTSELQSLTNLVCRLLLEKKKEE